MNNKKGWRKRIAFVALTLSLVFFLPEAFTRSIAAAGGTGGGGVGPNLFTTNVLEHLGLVATPEVVYSGDVVLIECKV